MSTVVQGKLGGWDLTQIEVQGGNSAAQVFNFELSLYGSEAVPGCILRGDGLLFRDGRVRFNREAELRQVLALMSETPQEVLESLAAQVRGQRGRSPLNKAVA
jgi:hypothetical protein